MSGRHPFRELTREFTPERQQRIDTMKSELLAEMSLLDELRRARILTQRDLAKMLKVNQFAVDMLEQRSDVYVAILRSCIEAMGGELKIIVEFPEGDITIKSFARAGEVETQETREDNPMQPHQSLVPAVL